MPADPWTNAPDYEEVRDTMLKIGSVKAKIALLDCQIDELENAVKKEKPRDTAARYDAAIVQHREKASLVAELHELTARQDWLNFWKDVYRTYTYNQRGV